MFMLLNIAILAAIRIAIVAEFILEYDDVVIRGWTVLGLYLAFILLPTLAICTRRLNDAGRSGWCLLVLIIPFIGAILLLVWLCEPSQAYEIRDRDYTPYTPPRAATPNIHPNISIMEAAGSASWDAVRCLVREGDYVDAKDKNGYTPLIYAAVSGNLEMVKFLHRNGANFGARDYEGKTALSWAAAMGHLDVVKYLHQNGANIHSRDNSGKDPIFWAIIQQHLEIITYLHEHGADINIQDYNGNDGLMHLLKHLKKRND